MNSKVSEIILLHADQKKKIAVKEYIEKNSSYLKSAFLSFCNDLENIKLKNNNLYKAFEIQNNHNLWEMSLIKEKSNIKSNNIYKIIILLAIQKIINDNKIDKIIFCNIPIDDKIIKSFFKNKKIIYEYTNKHNSHKSLKSVLKNFIIVKFVYYFFIMLKKLFVELRYNDHKDSDSNFVIFSYFAHFKNKKGSKLAFNQFDNLNGILKNKHDLDFQYIFVPGKNNKSVNVLPKFLKKNYSMLNNNLTFYNKLSIMYNFFFYSLKFFFIKRLIFSKLKNFKLCAFNLLSADYESSFSGSTLIENLIWINVFENYLSKTKKKTHGIFLLENQAWEKAMITAWKNHNHGEIIAYTPTSINYWHLYNFDYSKKNYSSPSKVLVSSNEGYKLLKEQYKKKDIKLHKVESLWFNYLLRVKKIKKNKQKEFILILGDYNPISNYKIFKIILNSDLATTKVIFFKPHPHDLHKYNIKNIIITNKNNEYFFKSPAVVISPGSTAAILEYLFFGKKVFIFDDPNGLDLSPVKQLSYQFKFKGIKDLNKLLKIDFNQKIIVNNFKNYYFLHKDLEKWKNFFYI